ncbi:MAG: HPr(Ser) kinase/phosphatase [Eubacteriales bacterium]
MRISIKQLCSDLNLKIIYNAGQEEIALTNSSINRPGLQLYGFYEHFDFDRVQIIGKVESAYLSHLCYEDKVEQVNKLLSYPFPCLVIAWGIEVEDYMMQAAIQHSKIILQSKRDTSRIIYKLMHYLDDYLAPVISIHGVLVEVYGIGVLITGSSGVGKSETALELVKRGHRLISDDVVEIKKIGDIHLIGRAPELLKQYMEIRGVGIIDVRTLYGIGAVKESVEIDMCIHLEKWEDGQYYDRLGLENEYMDILGIQVTKVTIPVSSGRNLAIIIETAARNNRQKVMGINSAKEFCDKVYKKTNE